MGLNLQITKKKKNGISYTTQFVDEVKIILRFSISALKRALEFVVRTFEFLTNVFVSLYYNSLKISFFTISRLMHPKTCQNGNIKRVGFVFKSF